MSDLQLFQVTHDLRTPIPVCKLRFWWTSLKTVAMTLDEYWYWPRQHDGHFGCDFQLRCFKTAIFSLHTCTMTKSYPEALRWRVKSKEIAHSLCVGETFVKKVLHLYDNTHSVAYPARRKSKHRRLSGTVAIFY